MNRISRPGWTVALLGAATAVALAAGCQPAQVGSRFVKSEKVGASGNTIAVSETESQALEGTSLEVGSGALLTETTITLEVGLADVVPSASAAGPVAVWEPSGLKFNKPVKMTLPLNLKQGQSDAELAIMVVEGDGKRLRIARSALEIDAARTRVSFFVDGFTSFQPSTGSSCTTDADCATGEACQSGVCRAMGGTAGGSGGTAGGSGGTAGGASGTAGGTGGTAGGAGSQCVNDRDCNPAVGELCVNGYCVGGGTAGGTGGTAGGSGGTAGGTGGTAGGAPVCTTCPTGQVCWSGSCTVIPCNAARPCPAPYTCNAMDLCE